MFFVEKVVILDFVTRFEENLVYFIKSNDLIREGEKILVAVSGGKDSMALLYSLNKIKERFSISLTAIHLDHMLRHDSWKERKVISDFANRLKVEFVSESRDVKAFLKSNPGYSLEEAARIVRYEYFFEKLKYLEGDKIALAHHKDDRVENFFLMLFRGAGLHGLSSMRANNPPFIRPFLFTNKSDISRYIQENSIPYVEDYTNYDTNIQRNKIRIIFLPIIRKEFCADIDKKVIRTVNVLEDYSRFIKEYSERFFEEIKLSETSNMIVLDFKKLHRENKVIVGEIIRIVFQRLKENVRGLNFEKISKVVELIKNSINFEYDLGDSIKVFKSYNKVFFFKDHDLTLKEFNYKIEGEGIYEIEEADMVIELKVSDRIEGLQVDEKTKVFDYDKIEWPIFARSRKAGDRIKPSGFRGHRKVKDILNEMKIPKWLRNGVLILQDSSGKIMWISGFRISEDFKITENTRRFLILKIVRGGIFNNYEFKG
ncbi:MAG: tRNA(Ile)-lysidine synthase [Thermotogaceae bacterium]|nr:tRNA(Ile)-lysidine synthase [Thermotogaceae bacterium]